MEILRILNDLSGHFAVFEENTQWADWHVCKHSYKPGQPIKSLGLKFKFNRTHSPRMSEFPVFKFEKMVRVMYVDSGYVRGR